MPSLVSIVVPVYNCEAYLNRCIDSLVNQTYKNLEIILVDDGSSDNSPFLCDEWSKNDRRVKVIHKINAGAGMARNTGVEHATGEYIFFVDSDDYLDLTTVEKCISKSQETSADLIIFGKNECYENGTVKPIPINPEKTFYKDNDITETILPGLFTYKIGVGISVWGKMFRLGLITQNNVSFCSEREIFSEDAYFTLEIFNFISSIAILKENLYFYCKNDNSYTQKIKTNHQILNDLFLQKSIALCERNSYPSAVKMCVYARYQMFALAGMKQIINTRLPAKEKYTLINSFFKNKTLKSTLTNKTLLLQGFFSRVFWCFLRFKLYPVCYILLWFKSRK
ncbi:MAG: glycosyltransferase family 2 protein [Clostridia bacterium]|nr:glycosyltransferase family 2 protein [Clostridia bacterium]